MIAAKRKDLAASLRTLADLLEQYEPSDTCWSAPAAWHSGCQSLWDSARAIAVDAGLRGAAPGDRLSSKERFDVTQALYTSALRRFEEAASIRKMAASSSIESVLVSVAAQMEALANEEMRLYNLLNDSEDIFVRKPRREPACQ